MKPTSIILLFAGLALASPTAVHKRQEDTGLDMPDDVPNLPAIGAPIGDAVPQIETYNRTLVIEIAVAAVSDSASASTVTDSPSATGDGLAARGATACTARSSNAAPVTVPTDSPDAFQSYPAFAAAASNAPTPNGYDLVKGFRNLKAAAMDSHYLTYTTKGLSSYDPNVCATKCSGMAGCQSFNIYYERDPMNVSPNTQAPDSKLCPATAVSPSTTLLKCAFYGIGLDFTKATNTGQYQGKFKVVIAGSNAYTKATLPAVDGYDLIGTPNDRIVTQGVEFFMGYLTFFEDTPNDYELCADVCSSNTVVLRDGYDTENGGCTAFNAFMVYLDGSQNGFFACEFFATGSIPDADLRANIDSTYVDKDALTVSGITFLDSVVFLQKLL